MDLDQRPLTFISPRTVDLLATFLDVRKILPTESGYLRDYRGLMDGARFNYHDTQRVEASSSHKTAEVIKIWMKKRITTENNEKRAVTFGDLKNALKEMDRFDALGAIDSLLLRDHNNSLQFSVSNNNVSEIEEIENATTRMGAVTMRDVRALSETQRLPSYNVMLMCDESDERFGSYVVERLEKAGQSVFFTPRDLLFGTEWLQLTEAARRCDKLFVILSQNFLTGPVNENVQKYLFNTFHRRDSVVPILYKREQALKVWAPMKDLVKCTYNPGNTLVNFWKRIFASLNVDCNSLPQDLLKMDFSVLDDDSVSNGTSPGPPSPHQTGIPTTSRMDTINSNGATSHENDTVLTDTGSIASTVDSERALLNTAPDPPNHEPGGRIMQGISKVKKTFSKKMKS